MTVKLKQGERGPVLELDPSMLRDMRIDFDTPLEVRAEGGRMIVSRSPLSEDNGTERDQAFREAMEFTFSEYDGTLRELSK